MSPTRAAGFAAAPLGPGPLRAGQADRQVQREIGLREVVKLASNENPLGPSPRAVEAAHAVLGRVPPLPRRPGDRAARRRWPGAWASPVAQVVIGNGSTELIDLARPRLPGARATTP